VAKNQEEFDPQVIATTMMGCAQETFEKMCNVTFSKSPEFIEKEIIEYEGRMRTFGQEKFNGPCYISALNFYLDNKDYKAKHACGVMVVYIEEEANEKLVRALGQPELDPEDEEIILDTCGEFCNVIAGQFKNELRSFGYIDLVISAPIKYRNDVPQGVDFPYSESKYYELSFHIWKERLIVLETVMAPVPHVG